MWITWFETLSRIGLFFASVLWVGLPLAWRMLSPDATASGNAPYSPIHLQKWVGMATGLLAMAATGLFVIQILGVGSENLSWPLLQWFVFESELGWMWLARVSMAGLASIFLPKLAVSRWWWVAAITGLLTQISISLVSHTAAHFPGPDVLIDFGHLLGSAIWAGGLLVLATHLHEWHTVSAKRERNGKRGGVRLIRKVTQRFATLGIVGVGLLAASGLSLVALHLPDLGELTKTQYGETLIIKTFLALGAMLLGGVHWLIVPRFLRTPTHAQGFILSIQIETAIVVGVLFLAARLTSLSPGHDAHHVVEASLAGPLKMLSGFILIGGIAALVWQWDKPELNS